MAYYTDARTENDLVANGVLTITARKKKWRQQVQLRAHGNRW